MAVNPAEDIVNVWLQDVRGFFTRQNVNVKKRKRVIGGKAIYGGRGKEIDILAINATGVRLWVEVTVSPNPYLGKSANRISDAMRVVADKFCTEKEVAVRQIFGGRQFQREFVYSRRIFKKDQEARFLAELKKSGKIKALPFEEIFHMTIKKIDHYSVDPTRIYLYYSKFFSKAPSAIIHSE